MSYHYLDRHKARLNRHELNMCVCVCVFIVVSQANYFHLENFLL